MFFWLVLMLKPMPEALPCSFVVAPRCPSVSISLLPPVVDLVALGEG